MAARPTTIRVEVAQLEPLRRLAGRRSTSLAETFDVALEALRRQQFAADMAGAERQLRADPEQWERYTQERSEWLNADLG